MNITSVNLLALLGLAALTTSVAMAQPERTDETSQPQIAPTRIVIVGADGKKHELKVTGKGEAAVDMSALLPMALLNNESMKLLQETKQARAKAEGELPPIEFGQVEWIEAYDKAVALAKKSGKPLMILFQEVPGCSTCQLFGCGPLSHPLLIDASKEFVPVVVKNNIEGIDRVVLNLFDEPTWNNPVVRFCSADRADLIPRKGGVYSTGELLQRMVTALKEAGRPVPEYLELVSFEYAPVKREWATFSMHCYWVGERLLGQLPGVLSTRIGSLDRKEVVDVQFDPTVISYATLLAKAQELECARTIYARTNKQLKFAQEMGYTNVSRSDEATDTSTTQQYHLANHKTYHFLPLTALQATKINASLANKEDPSRWLSPTQKQLTKRVALLIERDPRALKSLTPDRSPIGIIRYAAQLQGVIERESP